MSDTYQPSITIVAYTLQHVPPHLPWQTEGTNVPSHRHVCVNPANVLCIRPITSFERVASRAVWSSNGAIQPVPDSTETVIETASPGVSGAKEFLYVDLEVRDLSRLAAIAERKDISQRTLARLSPLSRLVLAVARINPDAISSFSPRRKPNDYRRLGWNCG